MYKISFILFMNIHGKRCSFYQLIHDYFKDGQESIDHQTLLELGEMAGLTRKMTEDEIIGCLYAPFLIKFSYDGTQYLLTNNARLKFADLLTEGKYQHAELGLSLYFEERCDRMKIHLTDGLSDTFLTNLRERGWSQNKSLFRLMKKTKHFDATIQEIGALLEMIPVYVENTDTFDDLVNHYGRYWPQLKTYTGNLSFKGHYTSELIPLYPGFFQELMETCRQPIDWKGSAITVSAFAELLVKHDMRKDGKEFIDECIKDGLIRHCSSQELTLTSSGYSLIRTYFRFSAETNYLQVIFRRQNSGSYLLMVAENNLYPEGVKSYLNTMLKYNQRGWFIMAGDKTQVIEQVVELKNRLKGWESSPPKYDQIGLG